MRPARFNKPRLPVCSDTGSAVLEFVGFGLLLQIPLLMMAINLAEVQQAQFAAEAIARHSLRSFILLGTPISEAADEILADFRITSEPRLLLSCKPIGECETSGTLITLEVSLGAAKAVSVMRLP